MKTTLTILSLLLLVPAVAAADELSATLTGNGQGFASIETGSGEVTYGIVTSGIGAVTSASLRQGGAVVVDLDVDQGSATGGSVFGTVSTAANLAAINANPQSFDLFVEGQSGSVSGSLVKAASGGGGGGGGGDAGTLAFTDTGLAIEEAGGPMVTLRVSRTGGTEGAVSVAYATVDGSAVAGEDYVAKSGNLSWANGEGGTKTFTVRILDDATLDPGESFTVVLSNPTNDATLGAASTATVSIADDEGIPAECVADETTLCLGENDRFHAVLEFDSGDQSGFARTIPLAVSPDSGLFYFFSQNNAEMLLKVLDGCDVPGFDSYWVFYAATTNVEFTLTVTDTEARVQRVYTNAQGNAAAPVQDTGAFATCP